MAASGYWTAAITHHAQEQRAAHHVERQDFEFYLPATARQLPSGVERREYLFPGYILIFIADQWRSLLGTRGISRMILVNEKPARIHQHEIDRIRSREDERGIIRLPPPFEAGQTIAVTGGVFDGFTGLVTGMPAADRVRVLLEMLGRAVEIELDRRVISAV